MARKPAKKKRTRKAATPTVSTSSSAKTITITNVPAPRPIEIKLTVTEEFETGLKRLQEIADRFEQLANRIDALLTEKLLGN